MPFKNRALAKRVAQAPCAWCGWKAGRRHAAHIIDEGPDAEWNAISLCPNCSTVFDEIIRPKLHRALREFGCGQLPYSWSKDNKLSSPQELLSEKEYRQMKTKLESVATKLKKSATLKTDTTRLDQRAAELLIRVQERIADRNG